MSKTPKIIYTLTDEAPALATYSLLPIIDAFTDAAGIEVETRDISLAARVLALFPDYLTEDQRIEDHLAELGALAKVPEANIIKLPNISASMPQLRAVIKELQEQGYPLPEYPSEPSNDEEKDIKARYDKVKGSAVNPVLREGNSDRRAPKAVKEYARKYPHSMGEWSQASRSHVSHMHKGDFYDGEKSITLDRARNVKMDLITKSGQTQVLKSNIPLLEGEIIDSMFMSKKALLEFYEQEIEDARKSGVMFSLHVKATMMKVSHPIVFGHCIKIFYKDAFEKHGELFKELGVDVNNGIANLYEKIETLSESQRDEIISDLHACHEKRPELAMVDSARGITNFHSPSDVIVDASMPAMIRAGGKMYGGDGRLKDVKAVMPESTFARIYQEMINFCKWHGAFDPATMGTVPNVGLMAQKAEEYGSHPTTFEMAAAGTVRMIAANGDTLHEHSVEAGDIWRSASTRQAPIENWVQLAIDRQKAEGCDAIFWLDESRAHDAELIKMVKPLLAAAGATDKFRIMAPREATRVSFETIFAGKDSIAVTGNVLRDYLTDLFPILELGTSAKMLSIVKLMNGGGLFETGAGGSAPKHVEQLVEQNHLRWDSLGEFCALGESLKYFGIVNNNTKATVLGAAVDVATQGILDHNKSPGRKVGQPDNRDSHFFFALYWAQALAEQTQDVELAAHFAPIAEALASKQDAITAELGAGRGVAVDLAGYYHTDDAKTGAVMAPSATLVEILGTA